MAKLLSGARWSPTPVADYEETYARTSTRLQNAKLYRKAAERWKEFRLSLNPKLLPSDPTHSEKRAYWFRTHYPPDELPVAYLKSSTATESSTPSSGLTSPDTLPSAFAPAVPSIADAALSGAGEPAVAVGSDSTPAEMPQGSSNPLLRNPPDNSCEILPTDMSTGLTLEECTIRAKWAMENAMHVATGRASIRKSPHAAACWLFVEAALADPRQFIVSILGTLEKIKKNEIDAFAKIEREKIAAMEKLEAAKAAELNERRSDDRDVSDLLAELGASEAAEGSRILQPVTQ